MGELYGEESPPLLRVRGSVLLREHQSGGAGELVPVVQRHQTRTDGEVVARGRRIGDDGEMKPGAAGAVDGVELHGVVVVVAGGTEEGEAVDAGGGDGVVEDAEDGVGTAAATAPAGGGFAGELGPLRSADGACDAAVADVGRDAWEVERVHALRCEDGLAAAAIIEAKRIQAYGT